MSKHQYKEIYKSYTNITTLQSSNARVNTQSPSEIGKFNSKLGNIKSTQPLNCSCGSKNLRFTKGKSCHGIQAWCRDCGASFPVAKVLAPHLEHLVEPDPPPETRVCRYCGKPATVVDEHYYQCRNCGDRLVRFNFGGEIDE